MASTCKWGRNETVRVRKYGRRMGELRSHLVHVERQAKTLRNKSDEWRIRRGLVRPGDIKSGDKVNEDLSPLAFKKKIRLRMRKGKGNEVFIRLA